MNPLHPLTIPTYRQLFAAMVLTIFAQGAWALYLAMQTLDLGATPATLSGVVVWSGIGLLAGSLPAGVIADRIPNKSVIVGVLTLNLAIATATSTAAILDIVTFWMLAVSAFIIGTSTAFFFPAYTALVPVLLDGDGLMAVNGLEGAARPLVGQAIAPAAVGAVIGASMPAAGGYLIAAALGLALLAALQLPAPHPRRVRGRRCGRLTDHRPARRLPLRFPHTLGPLQCPVRGRNGTGSDWTTRSPPTCPHALIA